MTTTRPSTARALAYLHCQPFLCTWNFDTPKHFGQFWFRLLFIVIRNPLASGIVDPIGSLIGIWFDILRYVLPSNACLLEFVIAIGFEMLACKVYKRGKKKQNRRFFAENTFVLAKGVQPHMFSFTNQKRWLQEAKTQGSKIESKGLDLFWLNTCGWSSKVGPTGKKSHHQANHPQIGHDGTNSRILCQRAPKLQNICFLLKMHLSLQKGTTTYVQLHQPKKGDLKRPRRRCQK